MKWLQPDWAFVFMGMLPESIPISRKIINFIWSVTPAYSLNQWYQCDSVRKKTSHCPSWSAAVRVSESSQLPGHQKHRTQSLVSESVWDKSSDFWVRFRPSCNPWNWTVSTWGIHILSMFKPPFPCMKSPHQFKLSCLFIHNQRGIVGLISNHQKLKYLTVQK